MPATTRIPELIRQHEDQLLRQWIDLQLADLGTRRVPEGQLRDNAREFLTEMRSALQSGSATDIRGPEWARMRDLLASLSRSRANQGFTPTETATFIFSFKQPFFSVLRETFSNDAQTLADETWTATQLLDRLGLFTTESFLKSRDEVIQRQQQEMLELSTPVVRLWNDILALPLIGTLDSARTQVVMQNLLQAIVDDEAAIAIIDITGVPTVDTLVAQHLLKTVAAARLMGADCIISGIRPQIAQTIIHLGVDLADVTTKATLADAFRLALARRGIDLARYQRRQQEA